jgi:hypothetical protein
MEELKIESTSEKADSTSAQKYQTKLPYVPNERFSEVTSALSYLNFIKKKVKKHHDTLVLLTSNYFELLGLYVVTANAIGPDELIENRAAWVEFEIWNRSADVLNGFVRIRIDPRQSLGGNPGAFEYRVDNLQSGQKITAAISFVIPRADYQNRVTVELCKFDDKSGGEFPAIIVLASDYLLFNVAAKFDIQLTNIFARQIASHNNDTVVVDFLGVDNSGTTWDDQKDLGNHGSSSERGGGISPDGLLPIGPFTAYYASGKYIIVTISIGNIGHTSKEEDAKNALKVVSAVGAQVATGVANSTFGNSPLWGALSSGADQLHDAIIDYAFADCDTMVGLDSFEVSDTELFDATLDPYDSKTVGREPYWKLDCYKRKGQTIYDLSPVPVLGGGCEDSHYITNFCVNRYRVPEVLHSYQTDGTLLMPDEVANFSTAFLDDSTIEYDWDLGKMDTFGDYEAPSSPGSKKFEIIKWKVSNANKRGPYIVYQDFALVLLT